MRHAAMFLGALATASGCSLFSGLDDFASEDPPDGGAVADAGTGETSPGGEDSSSDADDAGAVADGGADTGLDADAGAALVNLHPFGTFEQGCTNWGRYHSTLAASSTAHTGTGSCLVCTEGTDVIFTADDNGPIPNPVVGAEYVAEVWVRTAPGKPVAPYFGLTLRTRNDNPFAEPEKQFVNNGSVPPTATWQKLRVSLPVTKAAQKLNVVVGSDSDGGACFLMDDVAVYRTK